MTIVTLDNFEKEVMQTETPVVVDFWASWCGPCMMLAPVMEALEPEVPGVKFCKVNVDDERDLAMEFQIESIKRTGGYCPCRLSRTEENKCMCEEFRNQIKDPDFEGYCHCMLYYKEK